MLMFVEGVAGNSESQMLIGVRNSDLFISNNGASRTECKMNH